MFDKKRERWLLNTLCPFLSTAQWLHYEEGETQVRTELLERGLGDLHLNTETRGERRTLHSTPSSTHSHGTLSLLSNAPAFVHVSDAR